jgi:hypothetical protein
VLAEHAELSSRDRRTSTRHAIETLATARLRFAAADRPREHDLLGERVVARLEELGLLDVRDEVVADGQDTVDKLDVGAHGFTAPQSSQRVRHDGCSRFANSAAGASPKSCAGHEHVHDVAGLSGRRVPAPVPSFTFTRISSLTRAPPTRT